MSQWLKRIQIIVQMNCGNCNYFGDICLEYKSRIPIFERSILHTGRRATLVVDFDGEPVIIRGTITKVGGKTDPVFEMVKVEIEFMCSKRRIILDKACIPFRVVRVVGYDEWSMD